MSQLQTSLFLMQMDICSRIGFSVNEVNSLQGFCMDTLESTYGVLGGFSMDEPAYGATKVLNIQDDEEGFSGSIPPHEKGIIFQMNDECHQAEIITKLSKCAAFPCSSKTMSYDMDDDDKAIINPHCSSAPYLLNHLKPVSAMKGSRERRGVTGPKELSVKWAPDVYDPVPTPVLQTVINRRRKHGKKSKSKPKNVSKSSRGRF